MVSILYYIIITLFSLVLLYELVTRKDRTVILISIATVLIVFALRALHIK
ncbi:MAG: hypothetical protein MSA93_02350 [Spirochaetales bacterium]|nr:hypothetical protein [Spirochaetales bacterium]